MKNIVIIALSIFVLVLAGTTIYFWQNSQKNIENEIQKTEKKLGSDKKREIKKEESKNYDNINIEKEKIKVESKDEKLILDEKNSNIKWTEVTHQNFWKNPDIGSFENYNFANIKFSYPSDLKFECCLDRADGSGHSLFSEESKKLGQSEISFFNYSLAGCAKSNCSISDPIVKLSSKEKFDLVKKEILKTSKKDESIIIANPGMKIECFVNNNNRNCLLQTNENVLSFTFGNKSVEFIKEFLGKIEIDN